MVRHEAAEALGGIATPEVLPCLKEYVTREDISIMARESYQVASYMYEMGSSSFSWSAPQIERLPILIRSTKILAHSSRQVIEVVST